MKKLIVNADDFGMSRKINEGIIKAYKGGIVTSTTIMTNMPGFEKTVQLLRKHDDLGVGIHLNLTENYPVVKCLNNIINKDKELINANIKKALMQNLNLTEIETELEAQIIRGQNSGLGITHLDSHKHVHVLPGIQKVVLKLAKKFRIPKIRSPSDRVINSKLIFTKQYLKRLLINYYALKFKKNLRILNVKTPSNFFGILETGKLNIRNLANVIKHIPDGTSELMCHPGYLDYSIKGSLVRSRETELKALLSPKIKQIIKRKGIHLINYGDL